MRPSERRLNKPLFPSVSKFLSKNEPKPESPFPTQSRLPQASTSGPAHVVKNLPEPEPPEKNEGVLLQKNTGMVTSVRNRLAAGRKESFYYLTVPGILRIIEVLFATLNIAAFAFYCTYYEDIMETVIPPFFLSNTREMFFTMATFNSLIGCTNLVISGIFSSISNRAIVSSLYPFVFDLVQCMLVVGASISNIQFYARNYDILSRIAPKGLHVKNGIAFSGVILSLLHFASGIYDLVFFFQRLKFTGEEDQEDEP